jgi:hypothetical protein
MPRLQVTQLKQLAVQLLLVTSRMKVIHVDQRTNADVGNWNLSGDSVLRQVANCHPHRFCCEGQHILEQCMGLIPFPVDGMSSLVK